MKLEQIVDNCQIFSPEKNILLYLNVSVLAKYLTKFFVDIVHSALVFFFQVLKEHCNMQELY